MKISNDFKNWIKLFITIILACFGINFLIDFSVPELAIFLALLEAIVFSLIAVCIVKCCKNVTFL